MADKKLQLYLQYDIEKVYKNSEEEAKKVADVFTLYTLAQAAFLGNDKVQERILERQRRAYYGVLPAQDIKKQQDSDKPGKQVRKLVYEMVESKIDTSLPLPRIRANSKALFPVIERTEEMLKYEIDRILSEGINDQAERMTYVDGTMWYKIWWNPLNKKNDRAGDVEVSVMPMDAIYPQPGVSDYTKLEYLFERSVMSTAQIYDLYGKVVRSVRRIKDVSAPQGDGQQRTGTNVIDLINLVTFYFLNEDRTVGRVIFVEEDQTLISWEEEWLVKRINTAEEGKKPKLETLKYEILKEDLHKLVNQYKPEEQDADGNPRPDAVQQKVEANMERGMSQQDAVKAAAPWKGELFLSQGTEVPTYKIKELPFIPRVNVSKMNSIFGLSDAAMLLDTQDELNKALSRMGEKVQSSGGILFKSVQAKIDGDNKPMRVVDLRDPQTAAASKYVDINPNIQGDIQYAGMTYESGRSTIGINNSWQGKQDTTATSGKAKEIAAMGTAGRIEAPRVMKRLALAQVYRMMFMFKLAFSSQKTSFVKLLPEAKIQEQEWDKYMFLDRDDQGNLFYHDEFAFSVDSAATLSNDRQMMWQETLQMFQMGTMGPGADPRNLLTFWGIMEQLQHPLAKYAIASIKSGAEHLDPQTEQLLLQNPDVLKLAMQIADEEGLIEQRGGARANSGPETQGMNHASKVEANNEANRGNKQMDPSLKEGALAGGGA